MVKTEEEWKTRVWCGISCVLFGFSFFFFAVDDGATCGMIYPTILYRNLVFKHCAAIISLINNRVIKLNGYDIFDSIKRKKIESRNYVYKYFNI